MSTLTIFDQLINLGIETNMLETRENIIKHFAHHCIITEANHKMVILIQIYLWRWCYSELYEHVCNSKKLDIKALFDKTKKNITDIYKLEDTFPPNIYSWKHIKNLTKNIEPGTELLIPNYLIVKIK